jgi:hypothetical protein
VRRALAFALICCSGPDSPRATVPPAVAPLVADASPDVAMPDAPAADAAVVQAPVGEEMWLRGTTHVHAKPSGDSAEPVDGVIRWYEQHAYDFIVLTDHNRVTPAESTPKLIVIPGIELTFNRKNCEPPGDESTQCRIHVNGLGVSGRPEGKLEWSDYKEKNRVVLYERALAKAAELGASLVQLNHPQYYWGMTANVLAIIGPRVQLIEIANQQFTKWNLGNETHPSVEALWDAALSVGLTMWGVATDDAHDYRADGGGTYPAGGGWVMVKSRRDLLPSSLRSQPVGFTPRQE